MPFNLLKNYPEILELTAFSEPERNTSLRGVFKRDIEDNLGISYKGKPVRPVKGEEPEMQILFRHLTTVEIEEEENGRTVKRRIFEMDRSQRLHWIRHHIEERKEEVTQCALNAESD